MVRDISESIALFAATTSAAAEIATAIREPDTALARRATAFSPWREMVEAAKGTPDGGDDSQCPEIFTELARFRKLKTNKPCKRGHLRRRSDKCIRRVAAANSFAPSLPDFQDRGSETFFGYFEGI